MGLEAIHLYDSPLKETIEQIRKEWHHFCEGKESMCNKIMVILSSILYNFFLEHIKHDKKSKEQPVPSQQNTDEDDVYFRFGGAVISYMVKLRYKNIQQCSAATKKDILSQEITILMTINTKNKCDMPSYLQYRDRGYMYTPKSCFIPFFRERYLHKSCN